MEKAKTNFYMINYNTNTINSSLSAPLALPRVLTLYVEYKQG